MCVRFLSKEHTFTRPAKKWSHSLPEVKNIWYLISRLRSFCPCPCICLCHLPKIIRQMSFRWFCNWLNLYQHLSERKKNESISSCVLIFSQGYYLWWPCIEFSIGGFIRLILTSFTKMKVGIYLASSSIYILKYQLGFTRLSVCQCLVVIELMIHMWGYDISSVSPWKGCVGYGGR